MESRVNVIPIVHSMVVDILRSSTLFVTSLVVAILVTDGTTSFQTGNGGETTFQYSIPEEQPAGFPVANLVLDAKFDVLSITSPAPTIYGGGLRHESVVFEVFRGTHSEYFAVDSPSGRVTTNRTIDRDVICYKMAACVVRLDVAIVRPSQHFKVFKLHISITDVNDNSPQFDRSTMNIAIPESAASGYTLLLPAAIDRDYGVLGVRSYQLRSNDTANRFKLRDITGNEEDGGGDVMLVVNGKLDREIESVFRAELVAVDGGSPPRTGMIELMITVQDANDNSPLFDRQVYNVSIREDFPVNGVIITVRATDADQGINGQVIYSLGLHTESQYGDTFVIDRERGSLSVRRRLDYETTMSYTLSVSATDRGNEPRTTFAKIHVTIEDRNDNAPSIRVNALTPEGVAEIVENQPVGSFVAHISVDDVDSGANGRVICELLRSNGQFVLQSLVTSSDADNTVGYKLLSNVVFDRELNSDFSLTLECHDDGVPSLSSSRDLAVRVTDANDNPPRFDRTSYSATVDEELPVGQSLVKLIAGDQDAGENGRIKFALCSSDAIDNRMQSGMSAAVKSAPLVRVDSVTGQVTTAVVFDYEGLQGRPVIDLCVVAFDQGESVSLSSTATLTLTIVDINDRAPVFKQPAYTFATYENQPNDTEIGSVEAVDPDTTPHNRFEFVIVREVPPLRAFSVDAKSGRLATKKPLDREQISVHHLVLCAFDVDRQELMSQVNVTVHVADRNDNAPVITFPDPDNSTIEISRQAPIGYVITRVFATDADFASNARLSYTFVSGNSDLLFDIDPALGAVSIGADLRHSYSDHFDLLIAVSDEGSPPKSATLPLTIRLTSVPWSELANRQTAGDKSLRSQGDVFGLHEFGRHRLIVILLGCVTLLVVTLLVSAIVCVKCRQSKRSARRRKYNCSDVTTGDPKFTKHLMIDNNLSKMNEIPHDQSEQSNTEFERTDISRYVDMASINVPDVCEPFFGSQVSAEQRQTEELSNVPATMSRIPLQTTSGINTNPKLNAVVYQLPNESSTYPRSSVPLHHGNHGNRATVYSTSTYGQVEQSYPPPYSSPQYHHQQQQQQQQQAVIASDRRQRRHPFRESNDADLSQTSPTVTFAETDSSSGCSSINDVNPSSTTTSPGGASRYASIANRAPVTETDLDQVMLDHPGVVVTATGSPAHMICSCPTRHDDVYVSSSRDSEPTTTSIVSRGNGYCCSVQPLVTSQEMMVAVGYGSNNLPPPPSHLIHDERQASECNCARGRDNVLMMGATQSQTPTRCRQHPPPLPPPRLTSLASPGRQKNQ